MPKKKAAKKRAKKQAKGRYEPAVYTSDRMRASYVAHTVVSKAGGLIPLFEAEIAKALVEERRRIALHVANTADEFGEDMDSSLERLHSLISAILAEEDPSTFHRYHAPDCHCDAHGDRQHETVNIGPRQPTSSEPGEPAKDTR